MRPGTTSGPSWTDRSGTRTRLGAGTAGARVTVAAGSAFEATPRD